MGGLDAGSEWKSGDRHRGGVRDRQDDLRDVGPHGASVVVAGHSLAGAEEVAADICEEGGIAIAVGVDVAIEEQVKAMVDAAVSAFGGLDALA